MRATRPARSASSTSIIRPVRTRSIAFALPTARVSRCVPPMPGMMPSLISGWPNFALSAAMIRSHCMASSQPPPSAKPATAAITGLRIVAARCQFAAKSPRKASTKVLSAISLMSAPAANALSEPVITMQPILGSASNAFSAWPNSRNQRAVERVEGLRAIEPDQSDLAAGFDNDVLVAHGVSLFPYGLASPRRPRFGLLPPKLASERGGRSPSPPHAGEETITSGTPGNKTSSAHSARCV